MFAQEFLTVNTGAVAAASRFHHHQPYTISVRPSPLLNNGGQALDDSLTKVARTFRGEPRANISHRDWLKEQQVFQDSPKVVAEKTGMTPRAVENIRLGRNAISFDNLVELCRADPDFAAAFCEYIGVLKPGEAEFAGALTKAFNAYQRRKGE